MKTLIVAAIVLLSFSGWAQECSKENVKKFQKEINADFADPDKSPLENRDLDRFRSLDFYPIDLAFCVEAKLVRTPDEKPFPMPTTTARTPMYVKYGEVFFTIDSIQCKLDVFRNLDLAKIEEYKDHLFMPFTDLTSGNGSYGGGRYIDLYIPEGDTITIDFNRAYNPYCVYNHDYSCPIPPQQNDLAVEVKAGVKDFKKK